MTNFWESELGEITGKSEDAFVKQFRQIPDGTMALAKIDSFKNHENEYTGFKCLQIEWLLTDGEFKGQKVQQKIKVFGGDSYDKEPGRTKHRALNMLKLIYQLFNVKPQHNNEPTDQDLANFIGKTAGIRIQETAPNDKGKQYNWISEVHKSQGFQCETGSGLRLTSISNQNNIMKSVYDPTDREFSRNKQNESDSEFDDGIPF